MGACNAKEVDAEAIDRNKKIERMLKDDKKKNKIKLLLLGMAPFSSSISHFVVSQTQVRENREKAQ